MFQMQPAFFNPQKLPIITRETLPPEPPVTSIKVPDQFVQKCQVLAEEAHVAQAFGDHVYFLRFVWQGLQGNAYVVKYEYTTQDMMEFLTTQVSHKVVAKRYALAKSALLRAAKALKELKDLGWSHNHLSPEYVFYTGTEFKVRLAPESRLAATFDSNTQRTVFKATHLTECNDDQTEMLLGLSQRPEDSDEPAAVNNFAVDTYKRDVFAWAVFAFQVIFGEKPFSAQKSTKKPKTEDALFKHVVEKDWDKFWTFYTSQLERLKQTAGEKEVQNLKDLLENALTWNSAKRLSIEKVVSHPYFQNTP